MKIDPEALSVEAVRSPLPSEPDVVEYVHMSEPSWHGTDVRLCNLGQDIAGDGTDNWNAVTCPHCKKRGAWLYGFDRTDS